MQNSKTSSLQINTRQVLALVAITVLVIGVAQFADAKRPTFIANLSGSGDDKGKAVWKTEDGGLKRLDVELENLRANTTYTVIVNGQTVGTVTTNGFGDADTQFLSSSLPTVTTGSTAVIKNGSTTVLSGTFVLKS
ncbi:MAG: hypothetical protein ACT4N5_06230 [Nitrosopumilaceae archaeon]